MLFLSNGNGANKRGVAESIKFNVNLKTIYVKYEAFSPITLAILSAACCVQLSPKMMICNSNGVDVDYSVNTAFLWC